VNLTYRNKKGQVTATSQGDLFSIWGATCVPDRPHPDGWARCLPSGNYCKGANQWNHYRVEANDGVLKLAVNGHVVSGLSKCNPRKGYLALESEGSECHFRNLKIKELPSTDPKPDEVADVARGHRNLYTGLDLSGWQVADAARRHWHPQDTVLHYDGKGPARDHALRTAKEYGDGEFIMDFRFPTKTSKPCVFLIHDGHDALMHVRVSPNGHIAVRGKELIRVEGVERSASTLAATRTTLRPAGQWNRLQITHTAAVCGVRVNGRVVPELDSEVAPKARGAFVLQPGSAMDFANLFVREVK
jgi:hypothetical protein